jgi:amino acid transporter
MASDGRIYVWVKEAFGQREGLVAIWLQWFQMTIGFVSALTFIAAIFAYTFNPALSDTRYSSSLSASSSGGA